MRTSYNKGFIALISTIIISVVLLTLVIAVSFSGFFNRFSILGSEVNERSAALAEACVETAVLGLSQNTDYAENGKYILVGNSGCYICPVTGAGNLTVLVQASSSNAYTNIQIVTDPLTGEINPGTWTEIPTVTVDPSNGTCTTP